VVPFDSITDLSQDAPPDGGLGADTPVFGNADSAGNPISPSTS
jgi:hypothetical protein